MRIFGQLAAPIYQEMAAKHSYRHLVQYSPELPSKWKDELFRLASQFPVIHPVEVVDEDMQDTVANEILSWGKSYRGTVVWFRVDDDDVLARDYLDALEKYRNDNFAGMAISFPRIYTALSVQDELGFFRVDDSPYNSLGQAFVCRVDNNLGVFESPGMKPHHEIWRYLPTVVDATEAFALWLRHPEQDSVYGGSTPGAKLANLQAAMAKAPSANMPEVRTKFPTVAAKSITLGKPVLETKTLRPGLRSTVELGGAAEDQFFRVDYAIDFEAANHQGVVLCFSFEDDRGVEKQFPRDDKRGDYRRLYADEYGGGCIFFYLPAGSLLKSVVIQVDGAQSAVNEVNLTIRKA